MDPKEMIEYLKLIEDYLVEEWRKTQDKDAREEIERLAADIAELRKESEK